MLAGTQEAMQWAAGITERLASSHEVFVCENLTLPDQRIATATAEQLLEREVSSLTVLILVRKDLL